MAAGKNHLTRYMRFYLGGYDLSGDARSFGELQNSDEEVDIMGWSEAFHNYVADKRRSVGITDFQALMNDASGQAYAELKDGGATSVQASLFMGGGAAPAVGDVAYGLPGVQMSEIAGFDAQAAVFTASFLPDAAQYDADYDNPFGVVQAIDESLTATVNNSSFEDAAQTTKGGVGILQVIASSGGTWALKIQDSANDSDWSDLITFSADGSAVTSEYGTVSGTVDKYTRFQATRTSGTVTCIVSFMRNYR